MVKRKHLKVSLIPHTLKFKFKAGTSRGALEEHRIIYLRLENNGVVGIGEIAPLPKLSIDFGVNFMEVVDCIKWGNVASLGSADEIFSFVKSLELAPYPSLVFAIETALLDLYHGGVKQIFSCDFYGQEQGIPINGLIWMNDKKHMLKQVEEKLSAGFKCVKMKIGAINLDEELEVLGFIRSKFKSSEIILRVDANGAFNYNEAKDVLRSLEELGIHSIEQPIGVGQECFMRALAKYNKVGVALDEELIGINGKENKLKLVEEYQPNYLILKPTLLGGLHSCIEWVEVARELEIDWWLTSALESNIGLNAVSQLASYLNVENYQGLGTGQLYHNNIASPLKIDNGYLFYDKTIRWGEIDE